MQDSPEAIPWTDLSPRRPAEFECDGDRVWLRTRFDRERNEWEFPPTQVDTMDGGDNQWGTRRIGPHGTLYSFSTVHVSASREVPYTVGYVDFPEGLRVLAHVRVANDDWADSLRCDQAVVLRADDQSWWVEPTSAPIESEAGSPAETP